MMSLINTNKSYLSTMGITSDDPLVGVIVSVYYLGCAIGAVLFSLIADRLGRKVGLFSCLATASLGNLIMFVAGLGYSRGALAVMFLGRVIMGLGVGGVDSVVPVYSSELSEDDARGKALAQEFQSNIFGLNMAFGINLGVTVALGKSSQWAWRIPIIIMQVYPVLLLSLIERLPESPRWYVSHGRMDEAKAGLAKIYGDEEAEKRVQSLIDSHNAESDRSVGYMDMITPSHPQFHPTVITVMGQVNQALTGYGAVSVYGPQIFELLGFGVRTSEYLTQGNYISYLLLMTLAWLLIDAMGRRKVMVQGSGILTICFLLLALCGGLAQNADALGISKLAPAVPGILALYVATGAFGIGWLVTVWVSLLHPVPDPPLFSRHSPSSPSNTSCPVRSYKTSVHVTPTDHSTPPQLIPTEIYPTSCRAQGTAISVIIWGLSNFAITLLTPIMFNNLSFYLFLIFAFSNAFAGLWSYFYVPETGGRSFEDNQLFFEKAGEARTWRVGRVGREWKRMRYPKEGDQEGTVDAEETPLLRRVREQI